MRPEDRIQQQVIAWFDLAHKGLGVPDPRLLYAIPNGAYFGGGFKEKTGGGKVPLAVIRAGQLKRTGLRSGVPDLCLAVSRVHGRQFCGALYVELKAPGGKPSPVQKEVGALFRTAGNAVVVAVGFDECVNHICDYLAGRPIPPFSE